MDNLNKILNDQSNLERPHKYAAFKYVESEDVARAEWLIKYFQQFKEQGFEIILWKPGNDTVLEAIKDELLQVFDRDGGRGIVYVNYFDFTDPIYEPRPDENTNNLHEFYLLKWEAAQRVDFFNEKVFVKSELDKFEGRFSDEIKSLPVLGQWIEYLKGKINSSEEPKPRRSGLPNRQIALICQYENRPLTQSMGNSILREFGVTDIKPNSAKKLADDYRQFKTPSERTGNGVQTANDIRAILPYLSDKAKSIAEKELSQAIINQSKKNNE